MTIAFYTSAHGFGHFVRSAEVIKALPADIPVVLRTSVPLWFVRQELGERVVEVEPGEFDCGALGRDSFEIDARATFDRMRAIQEKNESALEDEINFLADRDVRLVVSDVPSFAIRAASAASVRSIVLSNFTWVEIYEHLAALARKAGDAETADLGTELAAEIRREYAIGDLLLIPGMGLEMGACAMQHPVPVIARRGRTKRETICARLGLDPNDPVYLIYMGRDGHAGADWSRLRKFSEAQFISFVEMPGAQGAGVRVLPEGLISHCDAVASADAVIGKLGYSLCAECLATSTPIIFPPRPDFAEYFALEREMIGSGLGLRIEAEKFVNFDWGKELAGAGKLAPRAEATPCDGAKVCANILAQGWREGSLSDVV